MHSLNAAIRAYELFATCGKRTHERTEKVELVGSDGKYFAVPLSILATGKSSEIILGRNDALYLEKRSSSHLRRRRKDKVNWVVAQLLDSLPSVHLSP
ncbi:hypothetical protein EVAR_18362_1 [Eumeta japonica]|uniref:Uncharacterized protein n=1 Tax=Eumeta variegata TaxID=151549 RepID=A0A4C1UTR3_EUMVA|nr:hypothetical protein EVAR_18362_1 [Eumeta japonica]